MAGKPTGRKVIAGALIFLSSCAALAVLIYGADFLVPIVIAFLIVGLISTGVDRLTKLGLAPWIAKVAAIAVGLVAIAAFVMILVTQAEAVSENWPKYAARLEALGVNLSGWLGAEVYGNLQEAIKGIDPTGPVSRLAESVGATLGAIALVIMYAAFLLAERGRMPEKFGYLVPDSERSARYFAVFNRVNRGIRRYLWIKTVMSLLTGGLCYLILRLYEVDFAEFWGLLIFLLNFIPSIGSIVGVILPSLLTLLQFDTIWVFVQVAVLMTCVQFVIGNIVEPKYMGQTLNLSPFVVIVALTFWGTIWGIEGMFLSVPFTASLVIICSNIPSLRWIAILLSADGRIDVSDETPPDRVNEKNGARLPMFGRAAASRAEIEELRRELEDLKKSSSARKP